ncbi:ABC transporter ATP-binding protein [Mucilaginibacter phyllosphaerae]|uniref:ABC transporter ATP-binding protein n=1 Tax=Mucilaginibacter phyllosphaerae TaxID=1812349 RepID=A0A4Y8A8K6_9SPHI|nr:ABC transporter ATP-binding protein [Mucilaginibacter phyllosphaerae]MBB3970662.1 ATP-binding cassette subfamily B protein [Mucilaginibacter phyllosphaerae]TEW64665.1 ABC transporter ATP-binding protein [Mucilaginibacter phyllosphaerae]GGH20126.1 ABC transporter [Mucilaginibacter phyllosphaerae]
MKDLAYLNKFFYKYRWRLVPGVLFVIISNIFGVLPAQVIRVAFDLVTENIGVYQLFDGFNRQQVIYDIFGSSLLLFGLLVLILALLRGLFLFFMRQTIILMSRHIEYDLKNEIYAHYQLLSLAFYRRHNTGDLMNRVTEDVSRVRMYLGPGIMYTINTVILFILVIYAMLTVNVRLAVFSVLPLPVLAVIIFYVNTIIEHRSEKIQQRLSGLSSFVQENFSGIRVIKSYVREAFVREKFAAESEDYKTQSMAMAKVQALFFPSMLLLIGLSNVITMYIGGVEVMKGNITPGNIAEFIVYLNMLAFPVISLGWVTSLIQRAAASQKRINEFLHEEPEIQSPIVAGHMLTGKIEFSNVTFNYPDTGITALKNVSFRANPGEIVAIIGRTGSGKSTIANLIMRMYDTTGGEILIDDKPLTRLNLNNYRSQIGFVPQEVFLFSDIISHNIAFSADVLDMPRVEQAAKDAAVYNNIMELEKGFETLIGERGVTLSGGQKQRVSIARAIVKHPQVLIFDDCLSAVDTRTEEEILSNLGRIMHGKTSIIISHRISTIKNADNILVLDNGEIVEQGTHAQLMNNKGPYFELYEKQLLEEEE